MEFSEAGADDSDAITRVAAASLRESYGHFVDDEQVDDLIATWYDADRIADELAAGTDWILAEDDGGLLGFAQVGLLDTDPVTGEIHWLHVAPDARERGIARQLLGRAQERVEKGGAERLHGLVLEANEEGTAFYEAHGFERVGEREVTVDGDTYRESVYRKPLGDAADAVAEAVVEVVPGPEGEDLYVNFSEAERGVEAPFYPTYRSRDLAERYGWYCSNCESVSNAMDSMGRIACNDCDNYRKATRWDSSYL